jgi:hypothetical protein
MPFVLIRRLGHRLHYWVSIAEVDRHPETRASHGRGSTAPQAAKIARAKAVNGSAKQT